MTTRDYRCPWGSNSSWTTIISISVATKISVYWSLTRKNNTKIFVGFFLLFLLWNTVFSIGSRKQYAVPREEEPKWKWRAIVTSCFIAVCQYAITKNEEIGTTVDSKIQRKTTKQFLNPHPKITFQSPYKLHTCFYNVLQWQHSDPEGQSSDWWENMHFPICNPNPSSHDSSQ